MTLWLGHLCVHALGLCGIGLVALLGRRLFRKEPIVVYRLLVLLLFTTLLVPAAQLAFQGRAASLLDASGTSPLPNPAVVAAEKAIAPTPEVSWGDDASHGPVSATPPAPPTGPGGTETASSPTAPPASNLPGPFRGESPLVGWLVLYLSGLAFCLLVHCIRWTRTMAILRRSHPVSDPDVVALWRKVSRKSRLRDSVELTVSREIAAPGCWGLRRHRIVLPESCLESGNTEALEWALRHELVHMERRDALVVVTQIVATSVFWFHPVVWWMSRELDRQREIACDHTVVRRTGRARSYALALMDHAARLLSAPEARTRQASAGLTTLLHWSRSMSQLQRRIRMLEHDPRDRSRTIALRFAPLSVFWIVLLVGQVALAATVLPPLDLWPDDAATVGSSQAGPDDPDADGDGLSDFLERHKYGTDPYRADSDGDGKPDSDWNERREFTYTIRTIVQVMPPYNRSMLNDDYQDVRVLDERPEYIELEVIHYPFNTVADSIPANPDWQRDAAMMSEYLEPGVTTNWDEEMQKDLLSTLKADGIDVPRLTDKEVVERVTTWLMDEIPGREMFCTYDTDFVDGKPRILPGREDSFQRGKGDPSWSFEKQLEHEVLGKGMYFNRSRGTCTSSAVLLTTVLRAVGIPTRMIIAIPAVDASNDREVEQVKTRLSNHRVRSTIYRGVKYLKNSFAAHTFNEVWVGGRWRRLNYNRLGQNILDPGVFGLLTHVHSFNDLSEARLAATWGSRNPDAVFRFNNPYSALTISDLFGEHCELENPTEAMSGEHVQLTMSKLYWFHSDDRPGWIGEDEAPKDGNGHLLAHVEEHLDGEGIRQYGTFYSQVDKHFVLRADGHEDVRMEAQRGFWVRGETREFYFHITRSELDKMVPGVHYTIEPRNSNSIYQWAVRPGTTISIGGESSSADRPEGDDAVAGALREHRFMTLKNLFWANTNDAPAPRYVQLDSDHGEYLVADVKEWFAEQGSDQIKTFTRNVDRDFHLEADGHPTIRARSAIGSVTGSDWKSVVLHVDHGELQKMKPGVDYALVPVNSGSKYEWRMEKELTIRLEE